MTMNILVHFTHPDGTDDSIMLSGDTVEDIRAQAKAELGARNIDSNNPKSNCWSEEIAAA